MRKKFDTNQKSDESIFETIKVVGSKGIVYSKLMDEFEKNNGRRHYSREEFFIRNLKEAMEANIESFLVPVCDPSLYYGEGKLQFIPGCKPAKGYSYNELRTMASLNGVRLGTRLEYILFLATLINSLTEEGYYTPLYQVCCDSSQLGYFKDSRNYNGGYENTGSRRRGGKCDLGNTSKILQDDTGLGFWRAGGGSSCSGYEKPLAYLIHFLPNPSMYDSKNDESVGWFVM